MARYFFHVHDGATFFDEQGEVFDSLADARRHAARYAAEILCSQPDQFWEGSEWRMDVADSTGLTLSTLMFVGMDAAAAGVPEAQHALLQGPRRTP